MIRSLERKDILEYIQLMQDFAVYDGHTERLDIQANRVEEAFFGNSQYVRSYVAEVDDVLVGFINFYPTFSSFEMNKTYWVDDVFVSAAYRSKRIGYQLFQAVKECAISEGCNRIDWLVRRDNILGRSFYDRIGAKVDEGTIFVKWRI